MFAAFLLTCARTRQLEYALQAHAVFTTQTKINQSRKGAGVTLGGGGEEEEGVRLVTNALIEVYAVYI